MLLATIFFRSFCNILLAFFRAEKSKNYGFADLLDGFLGVCIFLVVVLT
jgi:hypothetical protein